MSVKKENSLDDDSEFVDIFAESAKKAKQVRVAELDRKMKIIRERERDYFKNVVLPATGIQLEL